MPLLPHFDSNLAICHGIAGAQPFSGAEVTDVLLSRYGIMRGPTVQCASEMAREQ